MKTRLLLPALFIFTATALFAAEPDNGFTVHEWGTFTSVQGADGVQMDWNPLVAPELPRFVYDRAHAGSARIGGIVVAGKSSLVTRQRMETPVMYFYSDRPRVLDVAVRFPMGTITEWYPQESAAVPTVVSAPGKNPPALHWPKVEILTKEEAAQVTLPFDASGSHYYAARETDASLLRVREEKKPAEQEKFLFYRGVASFETPLAVRLGSSDPKQVSLANSGSEDLRNLFLYEVRADGSLSWLTLDRLGAGETFGMDLAKPTGTGADSLAEALRKALVGQGLYEKEAAAMVKTWESAWFAERGMRVLYLLPRAWTDRTLPLTVAPAPQKIERVMVARAEIITPAMEAALQGEIERYMAAQPEKRPKIIEETRALGFGRFANSVLRRVCSTSERSIQFQTLARELLQAASAPELKSAATN
ncbi:hypothetical protein [Chthoniobacter flavus]|nr:hypothetical protein [Chthoniobacter flavus]